MSGWMEFICAMAVFLLSHAIPVRPPVRDRLVSTFGQTPYLAGYSILSLAVLVWLVVAAGRAPYVEVIPPWPALRWIPVVTMPIACVVAVAGLSISNPLSFGGMGRGPYDPDRPGILAVSRHPVLLALGLWALAHLPANGSLAHVLLFGLFAGFSGLGMVLIDRRKTRRLGAEWHRLAQATALCSPRALPKALRPAAVIAGLAVYAVLLLLHATIIGVSPLP